MGCVRRTTPIYTWHEQAIIDWSQRVISCCLLPQCQALHTCCSGFLIATKCCDNKLHWLHVLVKSHPSHSTTLLSCLALQTCNLHRWIWFTLSYERAKVLLRLVSAWDMKQAGDLRDDTVQFIALNSCVAFNNTSRQHLPTISTNGDLSLPWWRDKHITENGRSVSRTTTCLWHYSEKKELCKTLRGCKYMRRNANRKMHPAHGVTIKSHDA